MLISEVPALREYWYPIGYSASFGGEPQQFRIFGEHYVAWRPAPGASVRAAFDECPHRAARLSQGWVDGDCIVCPYHGWRFDRTGACVEIPAAEPGVPVPPRAHLATVLTEERHGLVWVCVGTPRTGLPVLGEADDPAFTLIHELLEVWDVSAPRIIDNALDVGHVAFVHRNSVGSAANPRLSDFTVDRGAGNLRFSVTLTVAVNEEQKRNTGISSDLTQRTTHAELLDPFVFKGVLEYHENGLKHVLYKTATPIDDRTTLFCQFIARNDAPTPDRFDAIAAVDRLVQSEDRVLLEGVNPQFPIEITTEVHTKADRMTLEYRRVLAELAAESGTPLPDRAWARSV